MKHSPLSLIALAVMAMSLAAQAAAQATDAPSLLNKAPAKAAPQPTKAPPAPWCEDDCKTAGAAVAAPPAKAATALGAVPVKPAKPLNGQRANTGPGTQTEDDVYVGVKRQVQGVTSPLTATPQIRPGAGTSPNTGRSVSPGPATPLPK